jgi:hypothetical protein
MNDMTKNPEPEVDTHTHTTMSVSRADLTEAVRQTSLLADLTVSIWSGERTDHKISAKLKEDAHAVGNTGRYVKNLMAGADSELKSVRAAYLASRTLHYQLTLPWVTNPHVDRSASGRLLPNLLFHRYVSEMGALQRAAKEKLDAFLVDYPKLIIQAQANLAGLANPADYPDESQVRAAFRIDIDFQPIPAAAGFQGLPDAMLDKLGERLRARQERGIAAAQADMWARVRDSVSHLVKRLEDPEPHFKSATVEAVRELVTLIPGFNCAQDARANEVADEINRMLTGVSAEDIRKNDNVRQDVVSRAQAITEKLNQWGL